MRRPLTLFLAILATAATARAAAYNAASAADLAALTPAPGDEIILKDGTWTDQDLILKANGAPGRPITLRAQTPGKVILTGRSQVVLDGDYLVLSGLYLKDVARDGSGDAIAVPGNFCRVTQCAVVGGGTKFFVHLIGVENQLDHCYLANKTTGDPTLQVEVRQNQPVRHHITHNHFGPRPPLGRNGGETIRIGYSGQSQWVSGTVVERNLFDRCDGEIEIISSKSCENVFRYNTFLECAGFLTLRHGHRCVVDANFFIGRGKPGSGGVRVINEGHVVTNNYVEGVTQGGFWITAGIKDGPLTGYTRVKDALIAFNTVVDFEGPGVELASGLGTSNRTLVPEDVTIANNLFSPGPRGRIVKGSEGKYTWRGNVVADEGSGEHPGIRRVPGRLVRGSNGLLTLDPSVLAEGGVPGVTKDIEGQDRGAKPVVGCDQPADTEPVNRLLTAKDVGPSWLTDR